MILSKLVAFLRPHRSQVALAIVLSALTIGASISLMSTSALLISMAALHPSISAVGVAVVGVRFFGITRGLFRYAERLVSHSTSFKVLANFRVWVYSAIEPIAPAGITRFRLGDLLSRILSDIDNLENFFVRVFLPPATALVIVATVSLYMSMYSAILGAILFFGLLFIGVAISWITLSVSFAPGTRLTDLRSALREQIVDMLQGLADILSYGQQAQFMAKLRSISQPFYEQQRALGRINAMQTGFTSLATSLVIFSMAIVAIPLVNSNSVKGIHLAVILLGAMASFEAVQNLPQAMNLLGANLRSAARLFDLEQTTVAVSEPSQPQAVPSHPHIRFSQVSFSYGQEPILRSIDLDLPPGKKVAIVGKSGAGKSTLGHLLLRFWQPDQGEISLDGMDISLFHSDAVRKSISLVSQDTYLFNTSIRENLRIAKPSASDEQIMAACSHAGVDSFIESLPKKLDTIVGERGMQISGGEKQRLAIARAILKDAPVLVLDEPTSNLDAATEKMVVSTLLKVAMGKTVLWISHRPAGLSEMDEIVVLRDGAIVERGNHAVLAASGTAYSDFWSSATIEAD